MSEAPSPPPGLLTSENNSVAEPGRRTERRWLLGISLTTVLNLALTATAFGGLWLQGSSVELERDRAVTDQLTSAAELIEKQSSAAQAAGFRTLERVAIVSPAEQGYIVDLAESYLTAEAYKADEERSVAKRIDGYDGLPVAHVPNPAIQAAVTVLQKRDPKLDSAGHGKRAFQIPGMVVEAVRSRGIIMTFRGADLTDATFAGADLSEVDFSGVKSIAGADFSEATGIEQASGLVNANGYESARLPWSS